MPQNVDLKETLRKIRKDLVQARERVGRIEELTGGPVEREAGIWEFGFDELEEEMWKRFAVLEDTADCVTGEEYFERRGRLGSLLRKWKNFWRGVSGPFSRSVLDKRKQFNLDQQNRFNRENIPFILAAVLTMQKIKDRLNTLEESVRRLEKAQEDAFIDMGSADGGWVRPASGEKGEARNV